MAATRRSLQAQPKILKKLSEHQIYQSGRTFLQKEYVYNLKKEKEALEKNIETSNQPIRTNIFPKNVCLVPQKCKGVKNSYGGYPTEFAGSTQNLKKLSEH
jgi:hypothetical protein